MTQFLIPILVVTLVSYGLGCFSTAYYLVRWRTGQDIRTLGTGTAGARNVGRFLGKSGFALTFLGDALKGALAVGLARWAGLPDIGLVAAMLAVVAGHLWPVQLGGHGGKGASTGLGAILALNLWLGLITVGIALLLLAILRSFTRAGMIATALTPLTAWYLGLDTVLVVGVIVLILLLLFAHRDNVMAQRSPSAPIEPRTP
ncbi:MAG: glycerol-3-phosphate acyltransferase [Caldilineaceae bacterium]|nr:glycerol-3-phosphate acyltransferase [Caldilineaceae bacterium]